MHLADYMADKNLSDEEVSAALGRSRVSVSRWRRRLVRPKWQVISKIEIFSGGMVRPSDWKEIDRAPDTARKHTVRKHEAAE
jgi:transcriptional regulator with XRE-family HTH domain